MEIADILKILKTFVVHILHSTFFIKKLCVMYSPWERCHWDNAPCHKSKKPIKIARIGFRIASTFIIFNATEKSSTKIGIEKTLETVYHPRRKQCEIMKLNFSEKNLIVKRYDFSLPGTCLKLKVWFRSVQNSYNLSGVITVSYSTKEYLEERFAMKNACLFYLSSFTS